MGKCVDRGTKDNCKQDCSCWMSGLKFTCLLLLSTLSAGPLLCLTIQQVCVSKCLLLRRVPIMSQANADDFLLILLFAFYAAFNYIFLCVTWSLLSKCLKTLFIKGSSSSRVGRCLTNLVLMDPKKTRTGCVYGYHKEKYAKSDSEDSQQSRPQCD